VIAEVEDAIVIIVLSQIEYVSRLRNSIPVGKVWRERRRVVWWLCGVLGRFDWSFQETIHVGGLRV